MPPRSRLPEPVCRQHQACALVLRWGNPPWSFGDPLPTCQFSIRSVLWCGSYAALLSRMLKNPDPPSHSRFRSPQQLANPFSLYVLVVVVCWASALILGDCLIAAAERGQRRRASGRRERHLPDVRTQPARFRRDPAVARFIDRLLQVLDAEAKGATWSVRGNDGGESTRKSLNMQPSPYLEHEIARLIRTGFFRIPLIVDQAEVVVEGRARFGAISVVEYVVNIEHDLLRLGPTGHALKVGPSIADSRQEIAVRRSGRRWWASRFR